MQQNSESKTVSGISIKNNTVFNALKTISSVVFPLITFPYISRVLLPENVGKINFAISIVSYFSLIASLGVTTYAIRECSRVRDDKNKLGNTASQIYTINILTTIIAYLSLIATLLISRKLFNYRTLILIQSLTIASTTLGADWLNSAMEDFKYIAIRTVSFQFISIGLMFLLVHSPKDYIVYAMISLFSSAGANIVNIWYRKRYCKVTVLWNIKKDIEWRRHFIPILYLFVMLLAQTIFNSMDSTMLGLMIGDREVGIYSTAHKMINIINQLVASLLWVIMPRMSYYFENKDYQRINYLLRKVLGFNVIIGIPIIVGGVITAGDLVRVIAGPEYGESSNVLQILLIGFGFSLVGGNFLGNAVLLPSQKEKYYMCVCCATAMVNVIGNYFFIPVFGARAAAGTTAVCSLLILILLLLKVDKRIKIVNYRPLIFSPAVGCVGIAIMCYVCKLISNTWWRLSISIAGSILIYILILYLLKNELALEILKMIKGRILKTNGD